MRADHKEMLVSMLAGKLHRETLARWLGVSLNLPGFRSKDEKKAYRLGRLGTSASAVPKVAQVGWAKLELTKVWPTGKMEAGAAEAVVAGKAECVWTTPLSTLANVNGKRKETQCCICYLWS